MKKIFTILLLSGAITSCSSPYLTVQTDYLSHKNLASYYVGTPDPRLNCPAVGERLIISWSVPGKFLCYDDLHLEVTIRFRNREELVEIFNIHKDMGTYVFSLLNDDYLSRRGILTYKIDLIGAGGYIFEEWRHQIWSNLIAVSPDQPQQCQPDGKEDKNEEEFHIDWDE